MAIIVRVRRELVRRFTMSAAVEDALKNLDAWASQFANEFVPTWYRIPPAYRIPVMGMALLVVRAEQKKGLNDPKGSAITIHFMTLTLALSTSIHSLSSGPLPL